MRKKSTRLLSAALAACMMLSVLPVGAVAAQTGTESTESSVSAQATETLPFEGKEITAGGTYTMPSGTYTGNFVINTDEDVTINIEGNVDAKASGILWNVKKVHDLTIKNDEHTVEYAGAQILLVGAGAKADKVTVSGGTYLKKHSYDTAFEFNSKCKAELKEITVESLRCAVFTNDQFVGGELVITDSKFATDSLVALALYEGTTTLNNVEATAKTANVINNQSGSICNINGGTYTVTGEYLGIFNKGTMTIANNTKIVSETTSTATVLANAGNGQLFFNSGTIEVKGENARAAIRCDDSSKTTLNGGTIEGAEYGVWFRNGTPNVTLNNATFKNNKNDIYLNANQKITIEDTFTGLATVKVADDPIEDKRPVTNAGTTSQANLNLISNNVDANGKTYVVAYDEAGNYRYLAQRTGYTVTPVNATAATADGLLSKLDQIAEDTEVTLTADAAPEGKQFVGWKFEKVTSAGLEEVSVPVKEDTENPGTFKMPDYDLFVTAEYEDIIIDPGTSDSDYGGDIVAGVVIGGIAAVGAYEVGTGLYRITQMDDVAMPTNRIALAKLLWERAGKPEPESTALYSDIDAEDTDAQKAARWAVEQELLKDDTNEDEQKFHPAFPVSKLRVCLTWEKAKQKGLFDQNTEA